MDKTDDLEEFFKDAASNRMANTANFAAEYQILSRIDKCFTAPALRFSKSKSFICALLFLRSQYAFKSAVGMSLSGQVTEAFQMIRSCLEYAGYTLAISEKPRLESVWMGRNMTPEGMKAQKTAFKISEVRAAITRHDALLADIFNENYERAIDFGGHPNPHATMSTITMGGTEAEFFSVEALSSDSRVLMHALKSTAQAGLTALHIVKFVYPAEFEQHGVIQEMDALAKENL
jgi:hypothetical protein